MVDVFNAAVLLSAVQEEEAAIVCAQNSSMHATAQTNFIYLPEWTLLEL